MSSSPTPSAAQARIIAAALELFARNGVGGTSLQMIADEIGVTKAAVYHQYRTKDEIVVAVAEAELARLDAVLDVAEAAPSRKQQRDAVITGIVDLTIERGRSASSVMNDPLIAEVFADHKQFREVMHRLRRLLIGEDAGPEAAVRMAMIVAALSGAVMHPFVARLDDDTLRAQLLQLARSFLRAS